LESERVFIIDTNKASYVCVGKDVFEALIDMRQTYPDHDCWNEIVIGVTEI
jgi:hypothetical protein